MHSSSAACVFGDARLISSTSRKLAKTGPGRNSNSLAFWLKTFTPVTSDGSRSGVNCRRENEQSSERASAFASIVFPTPGKSSMIRCPSATRQRTTSRSVSWEACTTRRRFPTIAPTRSAGARSAGAGAWRAGSAKEPLHLVEDRGRDLVLRGLRHRTLAVCAEDRDLVLGRVEADVGASHIVEDEEVGLLVRELAACTLEPDLALVRSEADQYLTRRAPLAERGEPVRRRLELDRPRVAALRTLRRRRFRRPVVGHGGGHDHDVRVGAPAERLALEVGGGRRLDDLKTRRWQNGE